MCCRGQIADVINMDSDVVVDLKVLLEMFDDDREFVEHIMDDGLKTFKNTSQTLLPLLKCKDFVKISVVAHNLNGCSANLACAYLSSASSDLEKYTKESPKNRKFVEDKVKLVLKEIKRVEDFMKSSVYTNTLDREE